MAKKLTENKTTKTSSPSGKTIMIEEGNAAKYNIEKMIRESKGKIFSVAFIKRSTGEVRRMTCRLGVTKHLKGGTKAYDDKQHNLVTVFDTAIKEYRTIPLELVFELKINGVTYVRNIIKWEEKDGQPKATTTTSK